MRGGGVGSVQGGRTESGPRIGLAPPPIARSPHHFWEEIPVTSRKHAAWQGGGRAIPEWPGSFQALAELLNGGRAICRPLPSYFKVAGPFVKLFRSGSSSPAERARRAP